MHVAIDGFALWGPSRGRGIGTYVRTMLTALAGRDDVTVTVTVTGAVEVPPGIRTVRVPPRRTGPLGIVEHAWRSGGELDAVGADLVHVPGLPPPLRHRTPLAMTVHDALPVTDPASATHREAGLVRLCLPAVRRADLVVVPSRATARDLRRLRVPAERVRVVPNAVDPAFGPDGPAVHRDRPYVLLVAGADPRKRRALALETMAGVRGAGLPHRLVVVGDQTPAEAAAFRQAAHGQGLSDHVEVAGRVADLAPWYRGADALLVTSAGEGFGYPAVEAMACGTPVVALDNTATSEVLGEAGLLVGDDDAAALARSLVDLLRDSDRRRALGAAGPERAAAYGLDVFVQGLVDAWRSVLATRSR